MQNLKPAKLKAQTSNCSWMCFLFILAKLGVDQLHTYALNYLFIFSYKIKLLSFKMRISTMFASSNFKFGLHRVQLQWSEVKLLMCFLPLLWLESHINSTWLIRIFLSFFFRPHRCRSTTTNYCLGKHVNDGYEFQEIKQYDPITSGRCWTGNFF